MTGMLLAWVIIGLAIPNIWLSAVERMSVMQSVTNIILPAGCYMVLVSLSRHIGRTSLWMTIMFVFAAFQMVLLYMYGRSIIAVDMFINVATTNPGEVGELLGNLTIIILVAIMIYLPTIAAAIVAVSWKWRLSDRQQRITRRMGLWFVMAGVVCFICSFFNARTYRPLNDLYPVNIFYNLGTAIHRTMRVANYDKTSAGYSFNATSTRPDTIPETYIIVIGETSRADNWQIAGYDRPTTPRLIGCQGLVSFPRAISQSNTTHKSVPMLMSPLDAHNFGDSIYHVKSLITAFKEAGFHTAFFSAQSRNHSFIDFFGEEADTCVFIKESMERKPHFYDTDLLPYLDSQLQMKRNRKQLIVLHSYGSHFNYIDRYPHEQARFLPDSPASATYHFRRKQINAYDNTILFTSNFLADIIDRLRTLPGNAAMIYTSDHGEDIFDDQRRLFLHASPIPSYYQLHVPFIVWMNDCFIAASPEQHAALQANASKFVATSKSFFHTVMEMAGIRTPQLIPSESVVNKAYAPQPATYLNDHNDEIPLKDCGILHYDITRLDSLQIPLQ